MKKTVFILALTLLSSHFAQARIITCSDESKSISVTIDSQKIESLSADSVAMTLQSATITTTVLQVEKVTDGFLATFLNLETGSPFELLVKSTALTEAKSSLNLVELGAPGSLSSQTTLNCE